MNTHETSDSHPKVYELGYLIVPTVAEEHIPEETQNIKNVLEKFQAAFIAEDAARPRQLAYAMVKQVGGAKQKYDRAYFGWVKFEVSPDAVPSIKLELDKNERLLRFMIVNTVRENTLASQRMIFRPSSDADRATKSNEEAAKPASQEELDKTIDSLVVE